jgi:hypothetical protein
MYEKKTCIFTFIIICLVILLVGTKVYYSEQLDESGRINDQLTERLSDATDTNRRLTETVEQCQFIVTGIKDTTDRSIRTVSDAINIIEETREAVGALEAQLGLWDSDSYYDWLDSWLSSELEKNSVESK